MIVAKMTLRLYARVLRRALALCFACAVLLAGAAPVFAQEDAPKHDARLDGYANNVAQPSSSTALIWLLFVFLGVVALATLFKDAKRTHLD
jgi:hypothetical protein